MHRLQDWESRLGPYLCAVLVIVIGSLLLGCSNREEAAKIDHVMLALTRVEAKTQVGVALNDYLSSVADAKAAVSFAKQGVSRGSNAKTVERAEAIVRLYELAAKAWQHQTGMSRVRYFPTDAILRESDLAAEIVAMLPAADRLMAGEAIAEREERLIAEASALPIKPAPKPLTRDSGALFYARPCQNCPGRSDAEFSRIIVGAQALNGKPGDIAGSAGSRNGKVLHLDLPTAIQASWREAGAMLKGFEAERSH